VASWSTSATSPQFVSDLTKRVAAASTGCNCKSKSEKSEEDGRVHCEQSVDSRYVVPEQLFGVLVKQPFEEVVSQHGSTVLRVCRAVVGPVDADDAWSETFLSALKAYPQLPADANVEAWLVTIAHRKAIDVTRRTARAAVPVAEIPHQATRIGTDDRDLDLSRSLAALPEKQRFAVTYHYLGGLPYREVAAVIGGSVEAARRAAADGIANLRRNQGTIQ
jgi:RNA polymerase sigma factor (sigma-70 family)